MLYQSLRSKYISEDNTKTTKQVSWLDELIIKWVNHFKKDTVAVNPITFKLFEPNFPTGKKVDEVAQIKKDNIGYIKWLERSVDTYITKLKDDRIVIQ